MKEGNIYFNYEEAYKKLVEIFSKTCHILENNSKFYKENNKEISHYYSYPKVIQILKYHSKRVKFRL